MKIKKSSQKLVNLDEESVNSNSLIMHLILAKCFIGRYQVKRRELHVAAFISYCRSDPYQAFSFNDCCDVVNS